MYATRNHPLRLSNQGNDISGLVRFHVVLLWEQFKYRPAKLMAAWRWSEEYLAPAPTHHVTLFKSASPITARVRINDTVINNDDDNGECLELCRLESEETLAN
jgi:hypothetical protein